MAQMNMVQALNSAMDVMLERDPSVVILGEDVGYFGGVFRCTDGLQRKYGEHRVLDTPIAEGGIVAAAIGMGVHGLKPVAEIQFADYIYPAFDQIVSELARLRYRTAGEFSRAGHDAHALRRRHPRRPDPFAESRKAIFTHVCGIKVVMPSNPYDAKGLLISSIEDDDPVIFFEPKRIYNGPFDGDPHKPAVPWSAHPRGEVPEGHYTVPIGRAEIVRAGKEVTVLAYGTMVHVAQAAVRGQRHRCRDHRRAHAGAAGYRHAVRLGVQDRPLRDRARSHPLQRLRRRAGRHGAGALLLESRGADPARDRLGHALSARLRVGLLSRARRASRRRSRHVMEAA